MKKLIFSLLAILVGGFLEPLLAQNNSSLTAEKKEITVYDYSLFLKAVASRDTHHLYDPRMGVQLIKHSENNTEASYSIVHGEEQKPLFGLTLLEAERYCNWIENGSLIENEVGERALWSIEEGSYFFNGDEVSVNPNANYHVVENSGEVPFFSITTISDDSSTSPLMMFKGVESEESTDSSRGEERFEPNQVSRQTTDNVRGTALSIREETHHQALVQKAIHAADHAQSNLDVELMTGGDTSMRQHRIHTATEASTIANMLAAYVKATGHKKPLFLVQGEKIASHQNSLEQALHKATAWETILNESIRNVEAHRETSQKQHHDFQSKLTQAQAEVAAAAATAKEAADQRAEKVATVQERALQAGGAAIGLAIGNPGPLAVETLKLGASGGAALLAHMNVRKTTADADTATANLEYAIAKEASLKETIERAALLHGTLRSLQEIAACSTKVALEKVAASQPTAAIEADYQGAAEELIALRTEEAHNLVAWASDHLEETKRFKNSAAEELEAKKAARDLAENNYRHAPTGKAGKELAAKEAAQAAFKKAQEDLSNATTDILVAENYVTQAKTILDDTTSSNGAALEHHRVTLALKNARAKITALEGLVHQASMDYQAQKEVYNSKNIVAKTFSYVSAEKKARDAAKAKCSEYTNAVEQAKKQLPLLEQAVKTAAQSLAAVNIRLALWNNLRAWHLVGRAEEFTTEEALEKYRALKQAAFATPSYLNLISIGSSNSQKELEAIEALRAVAEKTDRLAKVAAGRTENITFEKEHEAYNAAGEAWAEISIVSQEEVRKEKRAGITSQQLSSLELLAHQAEAKANFWTAYSYQREAEKLESDLLPAEALMAQREAQAIRIETSWKKATEAFQNVITIGTKAGFQEEITEWSAALHQAETKKTTWTSKIAELRVVQFQKETEKEKLMQLSFETSTKKELSLGWTKDLYKYSSKTFQESADYLAHASKAEESGKTEITALWNEAASRSKEAAEQYKEAAEAGISGNAKEACDFFCIGGGLLLQAREMKYTALAIEAKITGQIELANKWNFVKQDNQHAANCYKKCALAQTTGKIAEAYKWLLGGWYLLCASEENGKAIEADLHHKSAVAQAWREVAIQSQRASNYSIKAANAYAEKKEEEGDRWGCVGLSYFNVGEQLEKALKAEAAGKIATSYSWYEVVQNSQNASAFYAKAAEAQAEGRIEIGSSWHKVGQAFYWGANKLEKAIEVKISRKPNVEAVVKLWREAADLQLKSAEFYIKAAEAQAEGRIEIGSSWNMVGEGFYWGADKLAKAIEVETSGKANAEATAKFWRDAAELGLKSVEFYTKAATAEAEGKTDEASSWGSMGEVNYNAAINLQKAIEVETSGKTNAEATAKFWREAAELGLKSVEFYTKAATAEAEGKTDEASSWRSMGEVNYNAAINLRKAIEVETSGKASAKSIANLWRETAAVQLKSVEFYTKAAKAQEEGKTDESGSWFITGYVLHGASMKLEKAIMAEESESPPIKATAKLWREAAEQQIKSVEFYTNAAKARAEGKTDEGSSWHNAGLGLYWGADKLEKAIEAEASGTLHAEATAKLWRNIAEQHQKSVEFFTNAAKAHAEEKKDEGSSWHDAGAAFYWGADKLEKAIEAEASGTLHAEATAKLWREAAEQQIKSVEFYTNAAKVKAEGKKDGGSSWHFAGQCFFQVAEKLAKVIEVETSGKANAEATAKLWREAADFQLKSGEFYIKAAQAKVGEKKDEGDNWHMAGTSFYNASTKFQKAIEAEASGKANTDIIAKLWREAAELQLKSVEFYIKAAQAKAEGKTDAGSRWRMVGEGFYNASTKFQKAIEAEISGKANAEATAKLWRETAERQLKSVEFYMKAATAEAEGKTYEGSSWNMAGEGFYWGADKLAKSIETEASGKPNVEAVVKLWREAAEQQIKSVEFYTNAAKARAEGKTDEGSSWHNAGLGLYWGADKLEKGIEAEASGTLHAEATAKLWREAADLQQKSTEFLIKAAQAKAEDKTDLYYSWNSAGRAFWSAAEDLGKAIEMEASGASNAEAVAKLWRTVAEQQQMSVAFFMKAATTHAVEKTEEGTCWQNAGDSLCRAAEKLAKAIHEETVGKANATIIAQSWREAAGQQQKLVDLFVSAATAYAARHTNEGDCYKNAGLGLLMASNQTSKVIELEANSELEQAKVWKKIAKQNEAASNSYKHAATVYAAKEKTAKSWNAIAGSQLRIAEKMLKAIEADAAEKPEIATAWRKAIKQEQLGCDYLIKGIAACDAGKAKEGNHWEQAGQSLLMEAEQMVKAIQADAAGASEVAAAWRKKALASRAIADHQLLAALESRSKDQQQIGAATAVGKEAPTSVATTPDTPKKSGWFGFGKKK